MDMRLMTLYNDGRGGGISTKVGNITLNIGKLMEATASGVLAITGAVQIPATIPLAALLVWVSLWRTAQVNITETKAAVLYVMWMHKNKDRDIAEDGLTEKCNQHLAKYGRPVISAQDVRRSLKALEHIGTIEQSPRDKALWWLREWVRPIYR